MPFDPLQTDEPIDSPQARKRDFEGQLMAGCTTIVLASLLTYGLTIWPWFIFPEYQISGLVTIVLTGMFPATVFGVVAGRRFGQSGASGFFGGGMASAVFMFLRLQQTMLGKLSVDLPAPEYPERWAWLTPVSWLVWVGLVALLSSRKEPRTH